MNVTVNGEAQKVQEGLTVAALLAQCKLEPRRVAVELNAELVSRKHFEATSLSDGDAVEIVTLVGGG